ncbi:hypothetical protein [Brenneria roseae]|nr:hypothetical protein [Brenneria roseae]
MKEKRPGHVFSALVSPMLKRVRVQQTSGMGRPGIGDNFSQALQDWKNE